jgi:hypothetical protein
VLCRMSKTSKKFHQEGDILADQLVGIHPRTGESYILDFFRHGIGCCGSGTMSFDTGVCASDCTYLGNSYQ